MQAETRSPGSGMSTRGERPPRRWEDAVEQARDDIAAALSRALGRGRLGRRGYQDWLAMESEVCRIGAYSLVAVAGWHGAQPPLRDTALTWAARLEALARDAGDDIRGLDGIAAAPPEPVRRWRSFAEGAGASQRAGEVLGAVLLHDGLAAGPLLPVLQALATLPGAGGGRYLRQRLGPAGGRHGSDRGALLDAYAGSALAVGAQRAAGWYADAIGELLGAPGRTGPG